MRTHPLAAQVLGFIVGIQKHYAKATLMLGGKSYMDVELVQLFQKCGDAADGATQAEALRASAVKAATAEAALVRPVANAFKKAVLAAFGSDAAILADFGLQPPKVGVKTPAVKSAAALKAAATRKALGTKGPQQKKAAKKALASHAEPAPAPVPPVPVKA